LQKFIATAPMPSQLMHFFVLYGYLAIFLTVFLQEIGIPAVVPNEASLFFFGYLSYQGNLNLGIVLTISILSEVTGTVLVYAVFYLFGSILIRNRPNWLPIPLVRIREFKSKIIKRGSRAIFIGRVTPFLRGYTSVIAGLIRTPARKYSGIVFMAAICSTGTYVMAGWLLAPQWQAMAAFFKNLGNYVFVLPVVIVISFVAIFLSKISNPAKDIPPAVSNPQNT
jgi:membrane protein DedA with SNARE-associated domain